MSPLGNHSSQSSYSFKMLNFKNRFGVPDHDLSVKKGERKGKTREEERKEGGVWMMGRGGVGLEISVSC